METVISGFLLLVLVTVQFATAVDVNLVPTRRPVDTELSSVNEQETLLREQGTTNCKTTQKWGSKSGQCRTASDCLNRPSSLPYDAINCASGYFCCAESSPKTCNVPGKGTGRCVSTDMCSKILGGSSTRFYCLGLPADVQCCTGINHPAYNDLCVTSAKWGSKQGTCMTNSACLAKQGSLPYDGTCPSGKYCCASSALVDCNVPWKGEGKCMSTDSCKNLYKGKSTPGYCPGPNDIQCCTNMLL